MPDKEWGTVEFTCRAANDTLVEVEYPVTSAADAKAAITEAFQRGVYLVEPLDEDAVDPCELITVYPPWRILTAVYAQGVGED
jgi:hypothetical protein